MRGRRFLFTLAMLCVTRTAWADWTASGTLQYRDRGYDGSGFTGTDPARAIRYADVEVVDTGTSAVLASGATDATGAFSIVVTDLTIRDIAIRVKTASDNTTGLHIEVRDNTSDNAVIAATVHTASTHLPTDDVAIGTVVVATGSGAEEFNIYDCLVDGVDYLKTLEGSWPGAAKSLVAYWESGSTDGTFYRNSDRTIHLLGKSSDSDAYDDSVILHEFGHFASFQYSQDDNPGGSHSINSNTQDPRLSWSEGWATFFACAVQTSRGYPASAGEHYVDTDGSSATGGLLLQYEIESLTSNTVSGLASAATYATSEAAVSVVLWDLIDSPGSDDDSLALGVGEVWEVLATYIAGLASSEVITVEDFWNGWFGTALDNGNQAAVTTIFQGRSIDYTADASETNDTFGTATAKTADGTETTHTHYKTVTATPPDPATNAVGDEDWFSFAATGDTVYTLATNDLVNGADTVLTLFDTDGSTQLDENDDRSGSDLSSSITWTATTTGTFYARVKRYVGGHSTYGTYDFKISLGTTSSSPDSGGGGGGGGGGGNGCFVGALPVSVGVRWLPILGVCWLAGSLAVRLLRRRRTVFARSRTFDGRDGCDPSEFRRKRF